MTENERQLLLRDLCARQFYGTKVLGPWEKDGPCELSAIDLTHNRQVRIFEDWFNIDDVKPYLRPMSSMTKDEVEQYYKIRTGEDRYKSLGELDAELFDFYHKNHIDYRGLIPMGLALEAPADMYKFE